MFDNKQSTIINTTLKQNAYCKKCKSEMIQFEGWESYTFVCINCGLKCEIYAPNKNKLSTNRIKIERIVWSKVEMKK